MWGKNKNRNGEISFEDDPGHAGAIRECGQYATKERQTACSF